MSMPRAGNTVKLRPDPLLKSIAATPASLPSRNSTLRTPPICEMSPTRCRISCLLNCLPQSST